MFGRSLAGVFACAVVFCAATSPASSASHTPGVPAPAVNPATAASFVAQTSARRLQDNREVALPAVGTALQRRIPVRRRPRARARLRAVMTAFRFDYRQTIFFVVGRRQTTGGEWLKVRIPGRPNGRTGWVRGSLLMLWRSAGPFRIVIDRSRRRLRLYRKTRLVMKAKVAVGTADAPTPLGRFYVTTAFRPTDDFLGPWAFETSAYAAITDWPRGGIVGLHGTSENWTVGRRSSHGCLRVYNKMILALKKRVRPGTPIRIRA